jgi:hypothetical protein
LGGKNRLGAREQGMISEKCRYSVTAERLLGCRSMERRDSVVTESAITTPKMTAICLKKNFMYQPNLTAFNPLVERATEAEHGFEGRFNSIYRWQLS